MQARGQRGTQWEPPRSSSPPATATGSRRTSHDRSRRPRRSSIVQEIFGVNPHIRSVVDRYAALGFHAIAPALFDRVERGVELGYTADDVARGREIRRRDRVGRRRCSTSAPRSPTWQPTGPVAAIGYCWGGSLAWLAASELPVAAAVGYYGGQITQFLDRAPKCPVHAPLRRARRGDPARRRRQDRRAVPRRRDPRLRRGRPRVQLRRPGDVPPGVGGAGARAHARLPRRDDHRLSRSLHHGAAAARRVPRRPAGAARRRSRRGRREGRRSRSATTRSARASRAPSSSCSASAAPTSRSSRRGRAGWVTTSATPTRRGSGASTATS